MCVLFNPVGFVPCRIHPYRKLQYGLCFLNRRKTCVCGGGANDKMKLPPLTPAPLSPTLHAKQCYLEGFPLSRGGDGQAGTSGTQHGLPTDGGTRGFPGPGRLHCWVCICPLRHQSLGPDWLPSCSPHTLPSVCTSAVGQWSLLGF